MQIDLTGQVVSDSIGTQFFSGFGGKLNLLTKFSILHNVTYTIHIFALRYHLYVVCRAS